MKAVLYCVLRVSFWVLRVWIRESCSGVVVGFFQLGGGEEKIASCGEEERSV